MKTELNHIYRQEVHFLDMKLHLCSHSQIAGVQELQNLFIFIYKHGAAGEGRSGVKDCANFYRTLHPNYNRILP